jgi:hypothetical protein
MNTVEFAVRDGVPVAIDFTNPAPDFDISSLGERFFQWVLDAMADLVIEKAEGAPYPVGPQYAAGPPASQPGGQLPAAAAGTQVAAPA